MEEHYRVISYADDLKPAITSMEELQLVNDASALFEAASGCRLHRDPASLKCKLLPLGKWRQQLSQDDLPDDCKYFVLSDHLDMVGVQLRATWIQTRKANGDIIQQRVSSTINPWRAGKFMPLTMRPWSVNTYALSKVWFRCGSVDLREGDISAISKSFKSWLYADLFEKPSEAVMCRPVSHGGLGVNSVRYKAKATLIRTFLETSVNPKFRHSLLHTTMFKYHVLGHTTVPNPGFPPYYPPSFFDTIRKVHQESPNEVSTMSIKEWSKFLTEENVTMDDPSTSHFTPCRAETSSPTTDFPLSWRLCRLKGLGSDLATFNFKLLHRLLVTRERQHQLGTAASPLCPLCSNASEDLQHALIQCDYNHDVGKKLLGSIKNYIPEISGPALLRLELPNIAEDLEFSLTFFTSSILMFIWDKRMVKSRISLYDIRATLEAKCLLLRKTRLAGKVPFLEELLNNS